MPEQLAADLDMYCSKYHYERSEFIRGIVREKIYDGEMEPSVADQVPTIETPQTITEPERTYTVTNETRFCDLHYETGVEYECRLVSFEDADGNTVIDHKWACPKCLAELEMRDYGVLTKF